MPGSRSEPLLKVENLTTTYDTDEGAVSAAEEVSFTVERGERVGIVGESGAGKSVIGRSILRLISAPGRIHESSAIRWKGKDLLDRTEAEMDGIRGAEIAWIPQDPLSSLNPTRSVGDQIIETMAAHDYGTSGDRRTRAIDLLDGVGIPDPEERLDDYPHEYSGGMRQRVLIAIALSCEPDLIIADEPTTALDVHTQAGLLNTLREVTSGGTALLFITHDLGVVAELCRRVLVVYAGRIIESSGVSALFDEPLHPYTEQLLRSTPGFESDRLRTIEGSMPTGTDYPSGCRFHPRCPEAMEKCSRIEPTLKHEGGDRTVACLLYEDT
jgi:peptide/nickel transport system ATP-binding protein